MQATTNFKCFISGPRRSNALWREPMPPWGTGAVAGVLVVGTTVGTRASDPTPLGLCWSGCVAT